MLLLEKRKWVDPLQLIAKIPDKEKCWAFLYSGMKLDFTGEFSILAIRPSKQIKSANFSDLLKNLSDNKNKYSNSWFGYLGYGLKNVLEKLPKDSPSYIKVPNLWMVNNQTIIVFNHTKKVLEIWSQDKFSFDKFFSTLQKTTSSKVARLNSNMSKKDYLDKVDKIKNLIIRGDLSQANLTRKFYGKFKSKPSPVNIFTKLCKISPSPYSCLIKLNDNYIISSSPELFLKADKNGNVESRPIKGSAPRHKNQSLDRKEKENLSKSPKNQAENLMIVDLMRNDLSRSCEIGSVKVKSLFDVTSYATIHQMSSTIIGKKKKQIPTLSMVMDSFPPGSMTGTPKIKAMEVCTSLEKKARGIYSGAIGWFGGDGTTELSVVIRTIILNKNNFEFQVGGAIVADSEPVKEFNETIDKAAAIIKVLGINKSVLQSL